MKAHNPGANFGSINDALTNAGYMKYTIDFALPGTYYIWARATHESGSDDSFHAALADGDIILSQVEYINFQGDLVAHNNVNNWAWIYYSNPLAGPASVDVPASGVFNFRIYIRERNFKLDKIMLTRDPTYVADSSSTGPDETLKVSGLESLVAGKSGYLEVYPNPVISDATISYILSKPELVSLKVYNVLGEEITTLADELQKAGKHDINWNTTELSGRELKEGLYFIKIMAGSESRTVKTILIR